MRLLLRLGVCVAIGTCVAVVLARSENGPAPPRAAPHVVTPRLAAGKARGHGFLGYQTVAPEPGRQLVLRLRPGGSVVASVRASMFGGPAVLGVVRRRGAWVAVASEALPNGVLGWVNTREAVAMNVVRTEIRVDLSTRRLGLYRDARLVRRFAVGVGTASSPTPTGRYAVAEKLPGSRFGAVYGCCILGLTAHQPRLPAGFDPSYTYLIGIHGGSGLGGAVSLGCLHMAESALRYLMRAVPLGTPVVISL
jgi:hypothetical protein